MHVADIHFGAEPSQDRTNNLGFRWTGKKVTGKKVTEKKSQKKITGNKVTGKKSQLPYKRPRNDEEMS